MRIEYIKQWILNTIGLIIFISFVLALALFYRETIDIHNDMRIS